MGRVRVNRITNGGSTRTSAYTYNEQWQLETVTENGVLAETYVYEDNGNRLALITPSGTIEGNYDAQDRMLAYAAFAYTYTAYGDLTSFARLSPHSSSDSRRAEYACMPERCRRREPAMSTVVTVGEPEPRKDGTVLFRVNVGGSEVHVTFSPLGIGVPADVPVSQANMASVAVTDHIADQRIDMVQYLRIAARLRREAHEQPPIDLSAGSHASVQQDARDCDPTQVHLLDDRLPHADQRDPV